MNCQLCGHVLGPTALMMGDRDFCVPAHRRSFHERLRRILVELTGPEMAVVTVAHFQRGGADALGAVEGPREYCLSGWKAQLRRLPGFAVPLAAEAVEIVAEPAPDRKAGIRSSKIREMLERTAIAG
ncbi:MAG: hypothetical protein KGN36_16105 [Acidobacteriota bacterium]|nr:hypothetical protein [Acidobacteriota bacterium]